MRSNLIFQLKINKFILVFYDNRIRTSLIIAPSDERVSMRKVCYLDCSNYRQADKRRNGRTIYVMRRLILHSQGIHSLEYSKNVCNEILYNVGDLSASCHVVYKNSRWVTLSGCVIEIGIIGNCS